MRSSASFHAKNAHQFSRMDRCGASFLVIVEEGKHALPLPPPFADVFDPIAQRGLRIIDLVPGRPGPWPRT
jgi:hypothetical protein